MTCHPAKAPQKHPTKKILTKTKVGDAETIREPDKKELASQLPTLWRITKSVNLRSYGLLLALCDNIKCNSNSLNCANHKNIKPYPLWLLVYFKKEIIIMQRDDVLL
jgi:hypothetical protein